MDELLPVFCDSLTNIDPDMENQHMIQVHAMRSAVGNKDVFATNVFPLKLSLHLPNEDTREKILNSTKDALLQILLSSSICSTLANTGN